MSADREKGAREKGSDPKSRNGPAGASHFWGLTPFRLTPIRHRRGYVLLAVLAISVLLVTVLATLAKISLRRGLAAADAERVLRQRWGAFTLQRAILPEAKHIFEKRDELAKQSPGKHPPAATIRDIVTISGVTFDLLLADEDAKLNLNSLYHSAGKMKTEQALAAILGPTGAMASRLIPATEPGSLTREAGKITRSEESDEVVELPDAFRSWGEVFDLSGLRRSAGPAALPNVTTGITCWGGGQLNIRRASDAAILAIAASVVQDGGARRLLERYRRNPQPALDVLLQTEVSNLDHRRRLDELLTEMSANYSLWIDASNKGGLSMRQFIVMRRDDEGVSRTSRFAD